jgi:hypothetical protein
VLSYTLLTIKVFYLFKMWLDINYSISIIQTSNINLNYI